VTLKELEAAMRRLEEQVRSLTEMVLAEEEDDQGTEPSLEAQHYAFVARLKEKRRC
jgi:hypothetical protein